MIGFLVNNKKYEIPLNQIETFPIKNSFINTLYSHYVNKTIGVEIIDSCLVIGNVFPNFDKIVKIYENPEIKLSQLIYSKIPETVDELFENNTLFYEDKYQEFLVELDYYGLLQLFFKDNNSFLNHIK